MSKGDRGLALWHPEATVAESPGQLRARPGALTTEVRALAYGPDKLEEAVITDPAQLESLRRKFPVIWVDVVGLGTIDTLQSVADIFGLHRLAMEDVLNVSQRPKVDEYEGNHYVVARMPVGDEHLMTEQLSIFLGSGFIVSFQEQPGDCLDGIRSRIRIGRPRLREGGADYLLYAILDAVVDSYFPLLESVGQTLEDLEKDILERTEQSQIEELHSLKRDLVTLRRYVTPLRDLNALLLRPDTDLLDEATRLYMRDCYDHSVSALTLVESYRDIASGLMELYLSMVSHRMNEVMKVLTVIATVFIPLSFIAGLYGMNFDPNVSRWNMPELGWRFGYPAALGVMALCAGGMLFYFRRKGWFR
jgi:magnesium transporter